MQTLSDCEDYIPPQLSYLTQAKKLHPSRKLETNVALSKSPSLKLLRKKIKNKVTYNSDNTPCKDAKDKSLLPDFSETSTNQSTPVKEDYLLQEDISIFESPVNKFKRKLIFDKEAKETTKVMCDRFIPKRKCEENFSASKFDCKDLIFAIHQRQDELQEQSFDENTRIYNTLLQSQLLDVQNPHQLLGGVLSNENNQPGDFLALSKYNAL